MGRHSSAPWFVGKNRYTEYGSPETCPLIVESNHWIIASVCADATDLREEVEANARLIAAAPRLLYALSGLLKHGTAFPGFMVGDQVREALDAVADADPGTATGAE